MFDEFIHRQNIYHLRRQLAAATDDATRVTIQKILDEEIERGERHRDAKRRRGSSHTEH